MIEFMIIAAPRSGTTWAANWLTTDSTLCFHDPLYKFHYTELDSIESDKVLGLSCTGLATFPEWLNKHPARKVILHRDMKEVNQSLADIGLPPVQVNLEKIRGNHFLWTDLFDRTKAHWIYEYLTELEFDVERYELLREIQMQPNFETLKVDHDVTKRLMQELIKCRG